MSLTLKFGLDGATGDTHVTSRPPVPVGRLSSDILVVVLWPHSRRSVRRVYCCVLTGTGSRMLHNSSDSEITFQNNGINGVYFKCLASSLSLILSLRVSLPPSLKETQ